MPSVPRTPITALAALIAAAVLLALALPAGSSPARTPAPSPGADAAKARLVRSFYAAFTAKDPDTVDPILATDWVDDPLPPGQAPGRAGFKPTLAGLRAAFPDLRVRIDELFVKGDQVVVRETFSGTQRGTFLGVPATNRRITFRAADIQVVRGKRIVRTKHLEDFYGALAQMGAAPR